MNNSHALNIKTVTELADLTGKKAVVTGGGGHLGYKMSEALLELGAHVIVIGQHPEKIKDLERDFGDRISFLRIDLTRKESIEELHAKLPQEIHVCVNNAYQWPTNTNFEKISWEEVGRTLIGGVVSPLFVSKLAFEKMPSGGSIINIASMYGMVSPDFRIYRDSGISNAVEYGSSKAALIQMTKYLAVHGALRGIRVNTVSPGPFSRPGSFDNGKEWFHEELVKKVPLGRIGENWELKGVVAFLASNMSTYVTGQNIVVDGGWTIW